MPIASHNIQSVTEICKVLGLEPTRVRKLVFTFEVGCIATVEVERYVTIDENKEIVTQLHTLKVED